MQPKMTGDTQKLKLVLVAIQNRLPQSVADLIVMSAEAGRLTIVWREAPSKFACGVIQQAWETLEGGSGTIEHIVADGDYSRRFVADVAADTIRSVMAAEQRKHQNSWQSRPDSEDLAHAQKDLVLLIKGDTSEPHIEHALTRLALVLARRKGATR